MGSKVITGNYQNGLNRNFGSFPLCKDQIMDLDKYAMNKGLKPIRRKSSRVATLKIILP